MGSEPAGTLRHRHPLASGSETPAPPRRRIAASAPLLPVRPCNVVTVTLLAQHHRHRQRRGRVGIVANSHLLARSRSRSPTQPKSRYFSQVELKASTDSIIAVTLPWHRWRSNHHHTAPHLTSPHLTSHPSPPPCSHGRRRSSQRNERRRTRRGRATCEGGGGGKERAGEWSGVVRRRRPTPAPGATNRTKAHGERGGPRGGPGGELMLINDP